MIQRALGGAAIVLGILALFAVPPFPAIGSLTLIAVGTILTLPE